MKYMLYILSLFLFVACSNNAEDISASDFSISLQDDVMYFNTQEETQTITISANKSWFVLTQQTTDWLQVENTEGEAGSNIPINISVSNNTTNKSRSTKISVVVEHIIKEISITQLGGVLVSIDEENTNNKISDKLIGFNCIYSYSPDDFWANTTIKEEMKNMGVGFIRWPGGAPTNRYHWNNLNGQGWKDNWDPEYNSSDDLPTDNYTSLSEYIEICKATGATSLVGINMGSALKWKDNPLVFDGKAYEKGLQEAIDLVQHCKDMNYNVDYFYLDNEPYHKGANYTMSPSEYATEIIRYAPAIKKINPNAKLIINWERATDVPLWNNILQKAGKHIDIVEVHWYWQHSEATFQKWIETTPMTAANKWYTNGKSYLEEIEYFNNKAQETGLTHLKLASLEWNVGPSATLDQFPTKYQNTLIQTEMLMQFMNGGLAYATMWPIFWPKLPAANDYCPNRYLVDPTDNYSYSPSLYMFKMLANASGKNKLTSTATDKNIYTLATSNDDNTQKQVFVLSKINEERSIEVKSSKYNKVTLSVLKADNASLEYGRTHIMPADAIKYNENTESYHFQLPAYSFARIEFLNN